MLSLLLVSFSRELDSVVSSLSWPNRRGSSTRLGLLLKLGGPESHHLTDGVVNEIREIGENGRIGNELGFVLNFFFFYHFGRVRHLGRVAPSRTE